MLTFLYGYAIVLLGSIIKGQILLAVELTNLNV